MKIRNSIAQRSKGAADLAIAALAHGDLVGRIGRVRVFDAGNEKLAYTVFQLDAVVRYHLLMEWRERMIESNVINFGLVVGRVRHAVCEITIVGEEDQP